MARGKTEEQPRGLPHPPRLQKLLTQVAQFYRRRFAEEPRARDYLAERGLKDAHALDVFGAGYCDGTLRDALPFDDRVLEDLKTLGILKENGKELLRECVVFPLWSTTGACVGLYGRRLFQSEVRHLYLPGPRRGLVNWQAAKRCTASGNELILAESILDALSLYVSGITEVLPCYGTGGFTPDHAELLRRFAPTRVAICFDGDESGRISAAKLASELEAAAKPSQSHGEGGARAVRVISLPMDTDANSLLVSEGAKALSQRMLLSSAAPVTKPEAPPFVAEPAPETVEAAPRVNAGAITAVEKNASGMTLHRSGRVYEVKASIRQGTQLRVTLKAFVAKEPEKFEVATLDFYSHRSRQWFAGLVASLCSIDAKEAEADLRAVLQHLETDNAQEARREGSSIELTDAERDEALSLLKRPTLMQEILEAFEAVGYAEELCNKQLGYLVAISRKLERPLSLLIESRSSAGKSALQDAVLSFVPDEDLNKYSRITDQALFYQDENALAHKLLVIEEATGMGGAVYSIRALQSGEELRVAATAKDPTTGKMKTEEYRVKAQTAVMMTTTDPTFDEETKSRFIRATVNESADLTRRILEVQRYADTIEGIALRKRGDRICKVHQNAQRLVRSLVVANPYAPKLTFPAESIQARRDNKKYLGLIKAVTLLHQHQRETKRKTLMGESLEFIEVTLADIAIANRIAKEVLVSRQADVTPQARQLLGLVRKMLLNGGGHEKDDTAAFTRRRLREHTGWSDWQVKTHLGELTELEYLRVRQGAFGKEYVYELADTHLLETLPGFGLTEVDALAAALCDAVPSNTKARAVTRPALHLAAS